MEAPAGTVNALKPQNGLRLDGPLTQPPHPHPQTQPPAVANPSTGAEKKKKKKKKKKVQKKGKEVQEDKKDEKEQIEEKVEIEYVRAEERIPTNDPGWSDFAAIFEHFARPEELTAAVKKPQLEYKLEATEDGSFVSVPIQADGSVAMMPTMEEPKKVLSKKERKRLKRMNIAVLKTVVKRPDVVEIHDVNSADPLFLVYLKSYRNSIAVPRHWSQKRKYLQNKRGIEKPPFELPDFIANTGISKIRAAVQEKDEQKRQKQKQRERMLPKMGKIDIDYQVLHDAFFRFQTKPKLTYVGDLYFEGKEFEVQLKQKKPGLLSEELKRSLGMPEGAPPPWLINMQRYGPPPSYPSLKIPGLNAPIPPGAQFGYHPGGWGKPPVDEFGHPLYGDVFGSTAPEPPPEQVAPIERKHWGEMEEEPEEEEEQAQGEIDIDEGGVAAGSASGAGLDTPLQEGISSVPGGLETPDEIELRKNRLRDDGGVAAAAAAAAIAAGIASEEDSVPKQLFTVLKEQQAKVGGALFGSAHTYVIPNKEAQAAGGPKDKNKVDLMKSQKTQGVNVTLNPTEVEEMDVLDEDLLKKKFEAALEEEASTKRPDDVSDIIADQQKKKRKQEKQKEKEKDKSKKYKEFKF